MTTGILRKTWQDGTVWEATVDPDGWDSEEEAFQESLEQLYPFPSTEAGTPWIIAFWRAVEGLNAEVAQEPEPEEELAAEEAEPFAEHDWAAMSESDWEAFAADDGWEKHKITRGPRKGQTVERKKLPSGSYVYRDAGAGKAREKAAKEKETARRAAEKAAAAAAKAKEKEAAKATEKKTKALSHLREISAGRQKPTPTRVRDIGAVLVTLKADELKALKAELGVKGGSTKAQMVERIQAKALAKPEGKAAKPVAKKEPAPKAKPEPQAAAKADNAVVQGEVARALLEDEDLASGGLVSIRGLRQKLAELSKEEFDKVVQDLVEQGVLTGHHEAFPWSDDKTEEYRAQLVPSTTYSDPYETGQQGFYVGLALDTRNSNAQKTLEDLASKADTGPLQPPEPGFTGTDSLGREWRDGKLVAAQEKPATAKPARVKPEPVAEPERAGVTPDEIARRVQDQGGIDLGLLHQEFAHLPPEVVNEAILNAWRQNRQGLRLVEVGDNRDFSPEEHERLAVAPSGSKYGYLVPAGDYDATPKTLWREGLRNRPQYQAAAPAATAGQPQPPKPGFTGTDSLGREWRDGKLVASQDKPATAKPARVKPEPKPPYPAADPVALARETAELYGRASAPEVTPERIDALGERLAGLSKEQLVAVAAEVDLKGVEGKSKAAIIKEVTDRIRFRKGATQKTKAIGRIPGGQPQVSRPDDWENPPDPDYVPITEPSRPRTVKPPKPEPTGIAREVHDLYERMADPSVTPADIDAMIDRLRSASKANVVAAAEAMEMLGMGTKSKEAVLEAIKDRMTYRKGMAIKVSNITPYGVDPREHRRTQASAAQPPEPGFTGTDSLGREWRNGKLVAAQEKPAAAKSARVKPEPKAQRQPAAKPQAAAGRLQQAIASSPSLTPEQKQRYSEAVTRVTSTMPAAAQERVSQHLKEAHFHGDTKTIGLAVVTEMEKTKLTDEERAQLAEFKRQIESGELDPGGAFSRTGRLDVDGDYQYSEPMPGKYSTGNEARAHEIYAHEIGHAIDGPNWELSSTSEWGIIWRAEIEHSPFLGSTGEPPLSAYGGQERSEGFAEFARLLYGSDVPLADIERDFPQASQFFKERGLWPEGRPGQPGGKMEEVFVERVPLGKANEAAHIDAVATTPPEPGFTGTDSLGREWRDGKLVAAQEKPKVTRTRKPNPQPAPSPQPSAEFGQAGSNHPLAGKSRKEQAQELGRLMWEGSGPDRMGLLAAGWPEGLDRRSFEEDVVGVLARHAQEFTVGPPLHELYEAVGQKYGLSKYDFLRAVTALHDDWNGVRLTGWPRSPAELPDPELAPIVGSKIMAYAHPSGGDVDALAQQAQRGDPALNTAGTRQRTGQRGTPTATPTATPSAPEPGFTGTDSLGREWRNGKLVAKRKES